MMEEEADRSKEVITGDDDLEKNETETGNEIGRESMGDGIDDTGLEHDADMDCGGSGRVLQDKETENNSVHKEIDKQKKKKKQNENEEGNELSNEEAVDDPSPSGLGPIDIILNTLFDFVEEEQVEILKQKLCELGVKSISDFKFLQSGVGLPQAFSGVLSAVQVGKLKENIDNYKPAEKAPNASKSSLVVDFEEILSPNLFKVVDEANCRVSDDNIKQLCWCLADHLYAAVRKPSLPKCLNLATAAFGRFNCALRSPDVSRKATTINKLSSSIFNRWKYVYRKDHKGTARAATKAPPLFSKRQNFGISKELDLPVAFPDGETRVTLLDKQRQLKNMYDSGEGSYNKICSLMSQTYVLQRCSVNEKLNMEKLLLQWPYFGRYKVLEAHFCKLMQVDMLEVTGRLAGFIPSFEKFMAAEGDRERTGQSAEIAPQIRTIMKQFRKFEKNATGNVESHRVASVLQCLVIKLKETVKKLFIFFEETASKDEIEASSRLPDTPVVVVLGKDLFQAEKCFVAVERRVISDTRSPLLKGIFSCFMLYWVLKLEYPRDLAGTLQFLEREIFCLNLDDTSGTSRVERGKTKNNKWRMNPPALNKKYVTCMEQYSNYCARWGE